MLNTIFTCWGMYLELVQTPILPLQGNMRVYVSFMIRSPQLTSMIRLQSTRGKYTPHLTEYWSHTLILTSYSSLARVYRFGR